MKQFAQENPDLILPTLEEAWLETSLGSVAFYHYLEYQPLFLTANAQASFKQEQPIKKDQLQSEFQQVVDEILTGLASSFPQASFVREVRGVQLLFWVDFQKKVVRVYSDRLFQEAFWLKHWKRDWSSAKYQALKKHIEPIKNHDLYGGPTLSEELTEEQKLPHLQNERTEELRKRMRHWQQKLQDQMHLYRPSWFEKLSNKLLQWTAEYELLRIHLLKFVAVLPSLYHDEHGSEVKRLFLEALRRLNEDSKRARQKKKITALPRWMEWLSQGVHTVAYAVPARPLASLIRNGVMKMARRFIGGESMKEAYQAIERLRETHRDITLDQLGELVVSQNEADAYYRRVLELIEGFSVHYPLGERNKAGIYRAHVSIKLSALTPYFLPEAPEFTYHSLNDRLKNILLEAKKNQVFVNLDAEHYTVRDLTITMLRWTIEQTPELKSFDGIGVVLQAYLRDAPAHLDELIDLARGLEHRLCIRLVKGAYWDEETMEAEALGHPAPEFLNKEETDIQYQQLMIRVLEHHENLQLALASHNLRDHCFAETYREFYAPDAPVIEHQCLHMTYEALSYGMAGLGWGVRNYMTLGSLLEGMAFLVRRIMENSSQVGILSQVRAREQTLHHRDPEEELAQSKKRRELHWDTMMTDNSGDFRNVPPLRLYLRRNHTFMQKALDDFFRNQMGQSYQNAFALNGEWVKIFSSSQPDLELGQIQFATTEDTRTAIEQAEKSFREGLWSGWEAQKRAGILAKAAELFWVHRAELASCIIYEGGKSVKEALADVDEAIDFINFYAREEVKLQQKEKRQGRGVLAAISPWNFPVAIPSGMVAAPLAAGNTVLLKSAEQTPLIAHRMVKLFHEAGVPKQALIHLPGDGETVGKTLVQDQRLAGYVFTGSKSVGTHILKTAGQRLNRHTPVHVVTEMGGKNAIVVTGTADLDEVMSGVLYSSFGHAGQKCSAASRVLVHRSVYERLKQRMKEAVAEIPVGEAFQFATQVNPLISETEQKRFQKEAKEAVQEAQIVGGEVLADRTDELGPGYCVGPAAVTLPKERAYETASYAQRELFGPFVHVIPFDSLSEAVRLFNSTEYGLTGGIFSQSQDEIDYLAEHLEAGNIYINQGCTAARVSIEPFGGFKHSGTGPKAGTPEYLESFHQPHLAEAPQVIPTQRLREDQFQHPRVRAASELLNQLNIGKSKSAIQNFLEELDQNLELFLRGHFKNREIPGQLSYNDYSQVKAKGLFLSSGTVQNAQIWLHFFSALILKSRLIILVGTAEQWKFWRMVANRLKGTILDDTIEVHEVDLKRPIEEPYFEEVEFVIANGTEKEIARWLKQVREAQIYSNYLISFHTVLNSPHPKDGFHYLWQYTRVRSFAINTLRYGAPMELELD